MEKMLTIAGAGIRGYSLSLIVEKLDLSSFDCLIADNAFNNDENNSLLNIEKLFLPFKEVTENIKSLLLQKKMFYMS
ncbi:MAG: hypothetical protein MZU97_01645 [Bacillus subtilis]|nr:hypothetical protein [Bacillus subtilis]